jgi:Sensors of blue-light using FAD
MASYKKSMMNLVRLVCVSSYIDNYGFDLPNLMDDYRGKFREFGLRSMTLFSSGDVMQLIEGELDEVENLIRQIRSDFKQTETFELFRENIQKFSIYEDSIGYLSTELWHVENNTSIIELFKISQNEIQDRVKETIARKLLLQFVRNHEGRP